LVFIAAFAVIVLVYFLNGFFESLIRVKLFLILQKYLVFRTNSWPTFRAAVYFAQVQLLPLSFYP